MHPKKPFTLLDRAAQGSNAAFAVVAQRLGFSIRKQEYEGTPMEGDKLFWVVRGTHRGFDILLEVHDDASHYNLLGGFHVRSVKTMVTLTAPAGKRWPNVRVVRSRRREASASLGAQFDQLLHLVAAVEVDGRQIRIEPKGDITNKWYALLYDVNVVTNPEALLAAIDAAMGIAEPV